MNSLSSWAGGKVWIGYGWLDLGLEAQWAHINAKKYEEDYAILSLG